MAHYLSHVLGFISVLAMLTLMTRDSEPQADPGTEQWLELMSVSVGKATYRVYRPQRSESVDLADLELGKEIIDNPSALRRVFRSPAQIKVALLDHGFAKLKDERSAPADLVQAQRTAQAQGLGLWKRSTPAPAVALSHSQAPQSLQPSRAVEGDGFTATLARLTSLAGGLLNAVVWAISFCGGLIAVVLVFRNWLTRERVTLLLMGESAAGKTWLWCRLKEPDIARADLPTELSRKTASGSLMYPKVYGHHVLIPTFVDLPGTQLGQQMTHMLNRRRFAQVRGLAWRRKVIWIVVVSPTRGDALAANDLDRDYMTLQLGYLALPAAALAAREVPKPSLVALAITKFDIFSSEAPDHKTSVAARAQLEKAFEGHKNRLAKECEIQKIPFSLVLTSALEGWGAEELLKRVHKVLYAN